MQVTESYTKHLGNFHQEGRPYADFDGVWTGTETRNPAGQQHLQNYLSYNVITYFENLRPGHNGGGWVDSGGINMGRPLSGGTNGFPLVLRGKYADGMLYVLSVPEDFSVHLEPHTYKAFAIR